MAADPDDEALSWSGATDPTHVSAPAPMRAKAGVVEREKVANSSPVLLIVFGILAGVYLLYAVGWGIHAFTHAARAVGVFSVIMYQFGEFLAIASPFLWAAALWLLVKRPVWRLLWLFIGVLVLAPWPFIVGG